ncbi:MBL fold metallo-hydrolase [Candidatus Palauibacter sp.]|uniref:MBL fold metallo-hydrolase n=1 Tax=Candidatus Palauibacter sp. TaxID=3101350 RepID=UPI003B517CC5
MCFGTIRKPSERQRWEPLRRALAVAFLAAFFAAPVFAVAPTAPTADPDSVLRITFLDVGQADAVLIQAPGGRTALVDAGRGDIVSLLRRFGVTEIDLLVATHPHADHIGGMAGVIETFPVRFYMDNGQPHTTQTYRRLLAALDARPEITYLEASPRTLTLGEVEVEVLPLLPRGSTEHNDRSVALVVRYGSFTAFLSGDSEVRQLSYLVGQGVVPEATLLKAPHHGSDNGFTWDFLAAAKPRVVVISAGRNNQYGHPRPAALNAFHASGAAVFRTDQHGHVSVEGRESGDYEVAYGGQVALQGGAARAEAGPPSARRVSALTAGAGGALSPGASGAVGIRIRVHADAPGNDHQNPNGEYAVLESLSSEDRAVGGWALCDLANHCFRFPAGAVLKAGEQLVVHTGAGRADGARYYMGRRQAVWNNSGDTATLYDDTGAVVVVFNY